MLSIVQVFRPIETLSLGSASSQMWCLIHRFTGGGQLGRETPWLQKLLSNEANISGFLSYVCLVSANSRGGREMATLISCALVSLGDFSKHFICRVILFINAVHLFMPMVNLWSQLFQVVLKENLPLATVKAKLPVQGLVWCAELCHLIFFSIIFFCIQFYFTLT